jgi:hypothetical protein
MNMINKIKKKLTAQNVNAQEQNNVVKKFSSLKEN